ncbi:30S ribosome-binding factor RbfA [Alteromonas oceanisediminis]|uniref:30S ribosome-binding factor RbfA n=1 Tax=Alteromonas oceanisediminis TaxID=2836180 RepID=UPI001BD9650C|nr:30S ribosome-binding factor RbfA [Alteromonas oceanisediminis]MBT0586618.1 30S ribosome-binding factor RbfA [Alteromonas oceanisediminis]
MAREFSRTDRVAQQVHKEVASILQNEIKHTEPDLIMVTVSGVEVSRDLAHAKVFVTFYENDEQLIEHSLKRLIDLRGMVRSILAKRLRMRSVPAIAFVRDASLTEGIRISNLVSQTVAEDERRAAAKAADSDAHKDGEKKDD